MFYHELSKLKSFEKKFNSPNFLFIAPNRTHQEFFEEKSYKVYYLSDIKYQECTEFKYSRNDVIDTQKKSIINLRSVYQENIYNKMDVLVSDILKINKVSYVIFSQAIEGLAGIIISSNAEKLGIKCFVPHSTRFFGTSFFSNNQFENLKFENLNLNETSVLKAKELVRNIRSKKKIHSYYSKQRKPKNIVKRLMNSVRRIILYEELDYPRLLVSLENNFSFIFRIKYFLKSIRVNKLIDIKSLDQLPKKFIFFPLQYTPESSINIPNPFFVDQLRLIDLIRYNMPKEYLLVVKENPAMIGRRNIFFYKKLSRKSGVRLVDAKLSTIKIIKQTSLVVSVSGTASLEAFIFKRPSMVFGKTFFAKFINIYGIDYNKLSETINKYLNRNIKEEEVIKYLTLVYRNSFEFKSGAVDYDNNILENINLNNFVDAIRI